MVNIRPADMDMHQGREEKAEAFVFKVFQLRLQEKQDFLLTPCCSFPMQSRKPSTWARHMASRNINASRQARVCDFNTQPSICLTFFLQWQTAPQPFVMASEAFQMKDKSCGLSYLCVPPGSWLSDSYSHMWIFWEGIGEPTHLCPR